MIEPRLAHDLLGEIGSYWDGIGLGLTCKRLSHLLDPDAHAIIHQHSGGTVSRLPNKWLHGTAMINPFGDTTHAHVECDRGAVISVRVTSMSGRVQTRHGVYRGYAWTWTNCGVYLHRNAHIRESYTEEEIPSALNALTRGMPDGKTRTLNAYTWPGLIFCTGR